MKNFRLTEKEMNTLAERYPTPFLVASLDKVEENYQFMRRHLPRAGVYYAMKANPTPQVLQKLAALGSHFDVASAGEMEILHELGVGGEQMIYANPVKDRAGLKAAAAFGVHRFTFDDESEIDKMAAAVPGADVLVRIAVRNNKALVDLNTKFGGAAGYCLRVRNITWISFYVHSFLFYFGIYEKLQKTKLFIAVANFRVIFRQLSNLSIVL